MLTFFQSQEIIEALLLAKTFGHELSTEAEDKTITKAIKYMSAAMREGKMPLGEHEGDVVEQSEPDQTVFQMRKAYGGR